MKVCLNIVKYLSFTFSLYIRDGVVPDLSC